MITTMPTVLVDFDSVLFPFCSAAIESLNDRFGTEYRMSDVTYWNWLAELPKEQATYLWHDLYPSEDWTMKQRPVAGAERVLDNLARIGVNTIIATDRKEYMRPLVRQWLSFRYAGSMGTDLRLCPSTTTSIKLGVAEAVDAIALIDDAPHHALAFASAGRRVFLVDAPYNRGVEHELITRVRHAGEAAHRLTMERVNFSFIEDEWIPALRSGAYAQGRGALRREIVFNSSAEEGATHEYCCLGVACDRLVKMGVLEPWVDEQFVHDYDLCLPPEAVNFIGMDTEGFGVPTSMLSDRLTILNDNDLVSFDGIADVLQSYLNTLRDRDEEYARYWETAA